MIGESPPPGRGFFYTGDSTLFHHTAEVMAAECRFPTDRDLFLRRFAARGSSLQTSRPIAATSPTRSSAAQESFRRGLQEVLVEFGCGEREMVVGSQNR